MPDVLERQRLIQGLKVPNTASVVGCGGTGFWTAMLLAMSGCKHLILVDSDVIEPSNYNRLPLKNVSGCYKVTTLREFLRAQLPSAVERVETYTEKIVTEADCSILAGTIFCCTDTLKSQRLVCAYAKKNHLPYQRIGYDGTILNVSKQFPLTFDENQEDEGGYSVTPSWVVPAVLAASLGVASQCYKQLCVMDDLSKINIAESSFIPEEVRKSIQQEAFDRGVEEGRDENPDIPDDYGYCPDCTLCEDRFRDGRTEGYDNAIQEILDNNMCGELLSAVEAYIDYHYPERRQDNE